MSNSPCLNNHTPDPDQLARVLVVDDEEGLSGCLAEYLALEGFAVKTAGDGVQGLEAHQSFRPHVVISDVLMPVMNGVEMVKSLRQRDPALKVMFMSGYLGTGRVKGDLALELKSQGFPLLSKPFRPKDLVKQLHSLLS